MANWKKDLDQHFEEQKISRKEMKSKEDVLKKQVKHFIKGPVEDAFSDLQKEFKKHKRILDVETKKDWAAALVKKNKHKEFVYEISMDADNGELKIDKRIYSANKKGKLKLKKEGKIGGRRGAGSIEKITKSDIISDFLKYYKEMTRFEK